ncbi:hypothetical protein ACIBF5_09590 [Micromonospora sp. NPDC050417]|uniref:hypothetical protein n=1 Tax=Micromonospora sp. NPDC050417 TaxID=3364280 RepID=UPI0037946AE5
MASPLTWSAEDLGGLDAPDLVNLLFGLVNRCALHAAGYGTDDYVIGDAVVALMGGPRWQLRAEQAARAGYWTRVQTGWQLIDDAENFLHIRRKSEVDWERQRKADNSNSALTVPVRLRDGDGCRYCGHIVNWAARRGNRAGTYDHRTPGQAAGSPDGLVVACNRCNAARGKHPHPDAWVLLPAPTTPYYSELTVAFLAAQDIAVPLSTTRPTTQVAGVPQIQPRPDTQPAPATTTPARPRDPRDTAPGDPAASRTTPRTTTGDPAAGRTTPSATRPRPDRRDQRDQAHRPTPRTPITQDQQRPADPADRQPPESGFVGSGRVGSGSPISQPPTNRRRGRRGRRGKPQPSVPRPAQPQPPPREHP